MQNKIAVSPKEKTYKNGVVLSASPILENVTMILEDTNKVEKCSGCGASQLRQNGTCMLCEVCGDTTGCS